MRIRLENLTKVFGEQRVLRQVNFDDDISTLAIIGPSGGGKSTLLRIIGGLEQPSAGQVYVGADRVDYRRQTLPSYRAKLGFVFQHSGLFAHLDAVSNIALPLRVVHGVGEEQARQKASDLLERFGLSGEAHKFPSQLSGGEKQRVAIARAVAPEPELLLLDEPTSALDPEYTAEVLDLVAGLAAGGTQLVIVTHEMGFAQKACRTVAFLHDGAIAEYGLSDEVFRSPQTGSLQRFLSKLRQWN